jgi:hypothetical protein
MARCRSSARRYIAGYEPIRDSGGEIIGIYYVGYKK